MTAQRALTVPRGAALYVGALIGPGLLLIPSLADRAAGPASTIAWIALLVLSGPLAITFAALGVRHPVAGGVAAYVEAAFGRRASAATGLCFMAAVFCGAPAVALIGGFYVADLTGSGTSVAVAVGFGMYATILVANGAGLRLSSGLQLGLSAVLVTVVAIAVAVALPSRAGEHWTPFAPHGWWAVGSAANILMWLFFGWEAVAQLAGEFRQPARDLPRAIALAFVVISGLYVGLAVATVVVTHGSGSRVPLADLIAVGFGRGGRDATTILAVALTMGTMNVYTGGCAKLTASLATQAVLPQWLAGDGDRDIPRRPLAIFATTSFAWLIALRYGLVSATTLIRATSACFIVVYLLALSAALRILQDVRLRIAAAFSLVLVSVVAAFSARYLAVPVVTVAVSLGVGYRAQRRAQFAAALADEQA
jgi:amino acid efflux transporter